LRTGLKLKWERLSPAEVTVIEENGDSAVLEIVLHQGINRQIRRMMKAVNLEVTRLVRVRIGSLELGDAKTGESRPLTSGEVADLKKL
jgi:23S rRNA pseudouridine2605 synthase